MKGIQSEQIHLELLYKKHISVKPITKEILKEFSKVKTKSRDILFHQGLSEVLGVSTNFVIVSTEDDKLAKGTLLQELDIPKQFSAENHFIEHFNQYLKVGWPDERQQVAVDLSALSGLAADVQCGFRADECEVGFTRYKKIIDDYFLKNLTNLDCLVNFLLDDNLDKSRINILLVVRILESIIKMTRSEKVKAYLQEKIKKKLLLLISSIKATKHKKEMDQFYLAKLIEDIFNSSYDMKSVLKKNLQCVYNFEFEYKRHCVPDLLQIRKFDPSNLLFEDEMFLFCRLVYFFEKNFDFFRKSFKFKAFYNDFYTVSFFSKIQMSKSYKLSTKNYQTILLVSQVQGKTKHVNW